MTQLADAPSTTARQGPTARLRSYRPSLHQRPHAHDRPHLSLLLAGTLVEESGGVDRRAVPGQFALRPAGFAHQAMFGQTGALIATMAIPFDAGDEPGFAWNAWTNAPRQLLHNLLGELARDGGEASVEETLWDALGGVGDRRYRQVPAWLRRSRDRLVEEQVGIGALAAEAGVHRVHFSREFARAFGCAPSVYRRRMCGLRAAAAAVEGRSAVDSAYACGFADQSHMCRVVKETTGTTFTRLGVLKEVVTSVQS